MDMDNMIGLADPNTEVIGKMVKKMATEQLRILMENLLQVCFSMTFNTGKEHRRGKTVQ